ncbi:Na/Pi cotransporter family protein [Rhizobium leguminosarum bv. viciae]|uniref:Na/Pi cotransporter family protein n=1 Tax=Rhizobium leguminosarum bv. viciae TaxID=387 RepID=A0A8I2KLJ6_RHILV|nr:Na/Pi cotransporter family protein [Rhizobium leguminosarum]NKM48811.1 Na/Pi cotransporter family protein [Rhizobium leguminosarum bv. viciae]
MASTVMTINLFGAVALLVFGLAQVREGMQRAFGANLRKGLATGTSNELRSFISGFVATVALQSSTGTALMVASFVERQIIAPRMAQIVLLGANIGTAATAWVVAGSVEWPSPLLIFSGLLAYRAGSPRRRAGGLALIGIGLMLLSLQLVGIATEPMLRSPEFVKFIIVLDNAWPLAFLISAGIALLSSSSLAAIVLILSLASTGLLSASLAVTLVLGANFGGALLPVVASLRSPPSVKRALLGNFLVRSIGCVIFLPLTEYVTDVVSAVPSELPMNAHLMFNVVTAALVWPFVSLLSKLTCRLVPDDETGPDKPRFLVPNRQTIPSVALANATRETLGIGDLVERMLLRTYEAFQGNDLSKLSEISLLEAQVDTLQQAVKAYLSELGRTGLDKDDSQRSLMIINYAINLEHIGDIIEKVLLPQVSRKASLELRFSPQDYERLKTLFCLTIENLHMAQTFFATHQVSLVSTLVDAHSKIAHLEKHAAESQLERLCDGCDQHIETSALHLDLLRDLKMINNHIISVIPLAEENHASASGAVESEPFPRTAVSHLL